MMVIELSCRLVSPLHTAAERYSNVQSCAPYVLGSTLRGAMLSQIIRRRCPAEQFDALMADNPGYHARCPGPCGAKPLFDVDQTRFSFGRFPDDKPPRAFRSRVAIDRERWSVAESALLQFEVIPPVNPDGSPVRFTFQVDVPDEDLFPLVREAAAWAGEDGIGAFRNQGFGRFVVDGTAKSLVLAADEAAPPGTYVIRAVTPYVIPCGRPFGDAALRQDIEEVFGGGWCERHLGPLTVREANLGYVGRWCYEGAEVKRCTRAVALPGSILRVEVISRIASEHTARLQRGIGEWAAFGFGRFSL